MYILPIYVNTAHEGGPDLIFQLASCDYCGELIFHGENHWLCFKNYYHRSCFACMSELLIDYDSWPVVHQYRCSKHRGQLLNSSDLRW